MQGPIPWDADKNSLVLSEFRALMKRWKFNPKPDRVWDDARWEPTPSNRNIWAGNCNDFAPMLKRNLIAAGLPEHALSLVICLMGSKGHMILAIDTDQGTALCCNVMGCWPLASENWKYYDFLCGEARGRGWESYAPTQPVGLDKLLGK